MIIIISTLSRNHPAEPPLLSCPIRRRVKVPRQALSMMKSSVLENKDSKIVQWPESLTQDPGFLVMPCSCCEYEFFTYIQDSAGSEQVSGLRRPLNAVGVPEGTKGLGKEAITRVMTRSLVDALSELCSSFLKGGNSAFIAVKESGLFPQTKYRSLE